MKYLKIFQNQKLKALNTHSLIETQHNTLTLFEFNHTHQYSVWVSFILVKLINFRKLVTGHVPWVWPSLKALML